MAEESLSAPKSEAVLIKGNILVVRPDRIGDVVLSTPVLEALKRDRPSASIHMLVRDYAAPVVEHNPHLEKLVVYETNGKHKGIGGFWKLVKELRAGNYGLAITLQANFRVSLAIVFAGVFQRLGPYSKWYSYLLFNRGIRQRRSAVEMHETDYNLMLLRKLGIRTPSKKLEPSITVNADAKERMRTYLKEIALMSPNATEPVKFIVVHPGMGGSALNWPEGYYIDMIHRLAMRGHALIVTGSVTERAMVERIVEKAKGEDGAKLPIIPFVGSDSRTGLADFIALLSLSQVVVAPSTGPLHIASALGKKTVSFYSPIRVQSALRWGPYSVDESRHRILVPDALCGQDFKCAGQKCHFYFCMERLGVDEALQNVIAQLETSK